MHLCNQATNQSIRHMRDVFSVTYPDSSIPSVGTIFTIFGCVANTHNVLIYVFLN
jgi:hypothetical protein